MIYNTYLNLLSQINFTKRARLSIGEELIDVTQVGGVFLLSTKVSENFPLELSRHSLDAPGSKLVQTEEGLCFIQEVTHLDRFMQFKILILNYLDLLHFWKQVIQDLEMAPLHRS